MAMRLRKRYALLGILLGLGAPLGSLAWRALTRGDVPLLTTLLSEWRHAGYYYTYMTVGTVASFGLFGFILGWRGEAMNDLSVTDGLTGLYNHRFLHDQLAQEIERAARYPAPLTCLMVDIDDFKKVNDRYGHPFGDEVLATTAKLIRDAVRRTDFVGRYGGEEFLVIMPQTPSDIALSLAQRVLKTVQDHRFGAAGAEVGVTLSIGLATYPAPHLGVKSKSALLSAADQALYQAKRSGKNQAVMWKP